MKRISLVVSVIVALALLGAAARPAAAVDLVDGFDFPLWPRDGSLGRPSPFGSYNARSPYLADEESRCYGKPMSELQHAGEDWDGPSRAPVYAIANGRVVWSGRTPDFYGVVIVEHRLPSNVANPWGTQTIYSMYGHLDPESVEDAGKDVQRGDVIGRLLDQGRESHLHLEVRRYGNMQDAPSSVNGYPFCNTSWAGPGFTDTNANPDWFGYTHPTNWIENHRRITPQPPAAPTLLTPADGASITEGSAVNLTWSATGAEYRGEIGLVEGTPTIFGWQSATSKNLGALPAGYSYAWRIKARNNVGESAWSAPRTFTVKLAAPAGVQAAAATCTQVNIAWNDRSGAEAGYIIYRDGREVGRTNANAEAYQDRTVTQNTTYSYTVKAFRANSVSDPSAAASVKTSACSGEQPTVKWIAPVTNDQVFRTFGGPITLEVAATSSLDIRQVAFTRWDPVANTYIELAVDDAAPYRTTIDANTLNSGWNQISAVATDANGNQNTTLIWLYRVYGRYLPLTSKP